MFMTAAFVFTAAMLLMTSIKMIGLIFGNGMTIPYFEPVLESGPDNWYVLYPSLFFQIWFWTDKFGVVV